MTTQKHPDSTRRPARAAAGLLVLLLLAAVAYIGLAALQPTDEETFERFIGRALTPDVTILAVTRRGGMDFQRVGICFRASAETATQIVAARGLLPDDAPSEAPGCIRSGDGQRFIRMTGPGSGGEDHTPVHGFSMTNQRLIHDAATGTVYYVFSGLD